ncbi:MAG: hypothetical protein ACT4OK_09120 [Gemmobacter sp.]
MRRVLLGGCAMAALTGGLVQAGGLEEPTMPVEVVADKTSSSAGGILIPLLLLILVAAAAASSSDGGGGEVIVESDRRLKTDATWVGLTRDAIPVWRYRYKGTPQVFEGVMAQDVAMRRPDALVTRSNGLLAVNYTRLGTVLRQVA